MSDLFDIEKFNVISDDENYYFFRSLEPGDIEDIENGVITTENGYTRLRTDRERWEESHNGHATYSNHSEVSLEEMYRHIKYGYSLQTNCISLTSNPYIAKMYGEQFSQNYVMITVPKKEMGEKVFLAGPYMLGEVQKKIEEFLENNEVETSILEDLEKVDKATDSKEIKELIKTRYTSEKPIDTRKSSMRKDVTYSAPHSRISSWQALDEEQNLAKNKIIGKLTILEQKGKMPKLIKTSKDNRNLIITIGGSFSTAEQIHYGEIVGEKVQDISTKMLDMFGLLQQVKGQDEQIVEELKQELIKAAKIGKTIEIPIESPLNSTYEVKNDISIDEMYKLTEGKVEYGKVNEVVKKMFYLSRSRLYAKELAKALNQLTGNNPKYKKIIEYIEKNGFDIEPEIFNRTTDGGMKVVETVNLSLKENEYVLAEKIKELSQEEYIGILEKGGLSNVSDIVTKTFSTMQTEKTSRERYYAEAIVDSYNWEEISKNGLNEDARKELIEKLQKYDIVKIYQKLKEAGIEEKDISKYVLNIVTRESFVNAEDFSKMLEENEELLQRKLSVEQIDRFLGYYDVKETKLKLRDYQQDAFDKSKELLSKRRFASVVMPTGGGKSFVSIAHILEHKDGKMLYLAPDDEILNQMMDYIIENVEGLSKTSEKKSKREIIKEKLNIEFETYPGLMARRNKELLKEQFDFIVLDELHRTGAEKWEKKLDILLENQKEETKVLGITATPTRDVDGRDMSVETSVKLGYTREEAEKGEHIAYYMDLVEAIQLGLVVNPKIVFCEYIIKVDGSLERLKEKIESIEDENVKSEKMEKFNELSRNLEQAEGIPEILQEYIKQGQRIIAFLPATAIETEDDKKTGEAKIKEYKKKIEEYFEGSEITPEFYSMLGTYGKGKNEAELKGFETSTSDAVKFMLVINKAREGLHIAGLNGMVWFRPLDENSYILYHQELGRVIYSIDPDNPPKDEDRPIVIDLANNTFRVRMDKEVNTYTKKSDYDLLCAVVDWVQKHNGGVLPDVESSSKQEKRYSATLYRLQNKYMKYFEDKAFQGLTPKEREEIQAILDKGYEIDLWDTELLPPIPEEKIDEILKVDAFEVSGVLKDYVELEEEVDFENGKDAYEEIIDWLEKHDGKMPQAMYKENGKTMSRDKMTKEQKKNVTLYARWQKSTERKILNKYVGENIEKVPEEYREKIRKLRDYGLGLKKMSTYEEVIEWLVTHNGEMPKEVDKKRGEMTEEEQYQSRLRKRFGQTSEYMFLRDYEGKPIEEVPKEYREKVDTLRNLGAKVEKRRVDAFQELIDWIESNNGKIPKTAFKKNGKILKKEFLTPEQQEQVRIMYNWRHSKEYKIFNEYAGKTPEKVPEKYIAMIEKLINYGLKKSKKPEEMWNEQYNLLKGLKDAKGEYQGLTEERVKKEQKSLKYKGSVTKGLILNGYNIWNWINTQKEELLKKYRGRTKKEIELDEEIDEEKKRRLLLLLDLKIKSNDEIWDENYEILRGLKEAQGEYFDLIEEKVKKEQEKLKNKGIVTRTLKLKNGDKEYSIGQWVGNQKQKLLNRYIGKTIEEIKKDESIDEEEKRRVLLLLDLGVKPTGKVTSQSLGQAGFGSPVEECDKAQADLARRVEELESNKGVTQDEN